MYYYILPTNQDLQHHGVLGMKWGVRRYQPYSVVPRGSGEGGKEVGEALKANKRIAKGNVKLAYKRTRDVAYDYSHVNDKINKLNKKGKTEKALDYTNKTKEAQTERKKILDEAMSQINKADLEIGQRAVNEMLNNQVIKYQVLESASGTIVYRTGVAALRMAGLNFWVPPVVVVPDYKTTAANKYINANRGKTSAIKQENNKSSGSLSSNNSSQINKAKKEDKYDIGFLEAIQNSEIMYTNNKSEMLKEYDKYLRDPEDYWKNGRHKLKEY